VVSKGELSNFLKSIQFEHSPVDLDNAFAVDGDALRAEVDLHFMKVQVWHTALVEVIGCNHWTALPASLNLHVLLSFCSTGLTPLLLSAQHCNCFSADADHHGAT
jgi:hypothetical protein